jgi:hypothetical protein
VKPHLPQSRGQITENLCECLLHTPDSLPRAVLSPNDRVAEEDLQLALHICYGLHYDGFEGVSEGWEWTPSLLGLRGQLEELFLRRLLDDRMLCRTHPGASLDFSELQSNLEALLSTGGGPSLSAYLNELGTEDTLREFVLHRSIYQRKEADPHTWVIPRIRGRAKSALVHLQADEYGGGRPGKSHAELFATTMAALDLDPSPGAYIDQVPGVTLATDNLISFFGLHRRWRGALVGHLAAFEMTSVVPMTRYAAAIRRIINSDHGAEFYDVHVEADVAHGEIAATDLIGGLTESDPDAATDIFFGAAALLAVERHFANHLLDSWALGASSLRLSTAGRGESITTHSPDLCLEDLRLDQVRYFEDGSPDDQGSKETYK